MEVQRALESSLKELETLLEYELLSQEEVRVLVTKRREFESRMRRFDMIKEDALEFIGFEMNLHRLVEKRKKRMNLRLPKHELNLTREFEQKTHQLFDVLLKNYKGDLDLWVAAIEFAQSVDDNKRVSILCGRGIRMFPTKEMFWLLSAKHELERNHDPARARKVLTTALKNLPRNETLWLEYFRMEFLFVNQVIERRVVQQLEVVDFHEELLKTVFRNAVEAVPHNATFQLDFLRVCDLFSEKRTAELVREFILAYLALDFPEDVLVLCELARNKVTTTEASSSSSVSAAWVEAQLLLVEEEQADKDDAVPARVDALCQRAEQHGVMSERLAVLADNVLVAAACGERLSRLERWTSTALFPQSVELWERRCELDANAFAKHTLPASEVTPAMWSLELERRPKEVLSILKKARAGAGGAIEQALVTQALLQEARTTNVGCQVSKLVVELERQVVNQVPEQSFEALWQQLVEDGSEDCSEKRRVLEQWVRRYPSQLSFQSYVAFEQQQRQPGGAAKAKAVLLRAMGSVKGFVMH